MVESSGKLIINFLNRVKLIISDRMMSVCCGQKQRPCVIQLALRCDPVVEVYNNYLRITRISVKEAPLTEIDGR